MKESSSSERLKEYMKKTGLKQIDIVRLSGIDKSVISHYISGTRLPAQRMLTILSETLNVSPVWLMGYDVNMDGSSKTPEQEQTKNIRSKSERELILDEINKLLKDCDNETLRKVVGMIRVIK